MSRARRMVAVGSLALAMAGCGPTPPNASRAAFEQKGLTWPLTVPDGTLGCTANAVWFERDGKRYGVNGFAKGQDYEAIEPIWAVNEKLMKELRAAGVTEGPTLRINIGDLISEGLKLC